jgi:hypothetical protein
MRYKVFAIDQKLIIYLKGVMNGKDVKGIRVCSCARFSGGGGGGIFSQYLSFSGVIAAGIGCYFAEDEAKLMAVDNFMRASGGYFSLDGTLDNAEKSAGIKTRFEVWPELYNQQLYPIVSYFYGYTNLLGDIVTLKGGLINDSTFMTAGSCVAADAGEGLGALMILKPHSLLKLGLGAYLGMLYFDKIYALSGDGRIDPGNGVYTASLAFSLPDAFDLTAGYRLPYTDEENGNADKPDQLFAGIKITAIKDTTLVLDAQLNGVSDDNITAMYGLTTAYRWDALKVGLDGVLQTKAGEDDPATGFMLYGSYAIKKLLPRFDIYFGTGGTGGKKYHWKYFLEGVTYKIHRIPSVIDVQCDQHDVG